VDNLTNKEFQNQVSDKLRLFGFDVETEWRAMKKQPSLYCPRVDIAIGPFVYNESCINEQHDFLIIKWQKSINSMLEFHNRNIANLSWEVPRTSFEELCYRNKTARCFMAVEIEDKVSRKHLIGAAVNVVALGRLGIVVACSHEKLNAFVKIRRYFWFLNLATNFDTTNMLILTRSQFVNSFNL
jgi:hypothetical protein